MSNTEPEKSSENLSETEQYWTTFDNSTDSASKAVISAVTTALAENPVELPPLYTAIGPDALDVLFRPKRTAPRRGDRCLQFTFNSHEVTVKSSGVIIVDPLKEVQL